MLTVKLVQVDLVGQVHPHSLAIVSLVDGQLPGSRGPGPGSLEEAREQNPRPAPLLPLPLPVLGTGATGRRGRVSGRRAGRRSSQRNGQRENRLQSQNASKHLATCNEH